MDARQLELHGRTVAYRGGGEGPGVVLIHGMAGSSQTWDAIIPHLSQHATVIAPDMLGHGGSAKPRGDYSLGALASGVRDVMVALGHERATIVGQSLGGGVAMQFAYQFPERTERLVLVSSGGLGPEVSGLLRWLSVPGAEYALALGTAPGLRRLGLAATGWLERLGLRPAPAAAEIMRSYVALGDLETRTAFMSTLRAVVDLGGQRASAADRLYLAAAVPTLIVWGDKDSLIPVAHAHAAHEAMPGSRLEIFEGSGHFPHRDDPDRFAHLLRDFIDTTEPADLSAAKIRELLIPRVG